jgi:integrase
MSKKKKSKTMRLPNGYGSVYMLTGNRRRPWVARKTLGWTDDGRQIFYIVGYYKKRQDALDALADYNKNPIGDLRDITLQEIWNRWSKSKFPKISRSTKETYEAAWKHLAPIKDMLVREIRKSHIQNIIDDMADKKLSYSACSKVKTLAGTLLNEAIADKIIFDNCASLVELPENDARKKNSFTDFEILAISKLAEDGHIWAGTILIMIYTGLRITEFLTLTKFNVDLDKMTITAGIKTEAGKNRVIPIHPKIQKYVKYWYDQGGERLITLDGKRILPRYYRENLYHPTLKQAKVRPLNPHSTRHTFASLLDKAGVRTKHIQDLIGHSDYSTTANIYTHPDVDTLRQAIESI